MVIMSPGSHALARCSGSHRTLRDSRYACTINFRYKNLITYIHLDTAKSVHRIVSAFKDPTCRHSPQVNTFLKAPFRGTNTSAKLRKFQNYLPGYLICVVGLRVFEIRITCNLDQLLLSKASHCFRRRLLNPTYLDDQRRRNVFWWANAYHYRPQGGHRFFSGQRAGHIQYTSMPCRSRHDKIHLRSLWR